MVAQILFKESLGWYRGAPRLLKQRIDFVAASLLDLGYQLRVVRYYARDWARFLRTVNRRARKLPTSIHDPQVQDYLQRETSAVSASRWRAVRARIRILLEMDENGRFASRIRRPAEQRTPLFESLVPAYLDHYVALHEVGPRWLRRREYQLGLFTEFLRRRRVTAWRRVGVPRIRAFLEGLTELAPATRSSYAYCLRSFFRWAYLEEILEADLSGGIPTVRNYRLAGLPDVLDPDEVELLLSSVDRSTKIGRRDYAVLLLAARYGMRPSDIRQLTLDHLDPARRRIVFVQSKTRNELELPLLEDVGVALHDYVRHARPATESRNVFIRHKAPFEPFCRANTLNQVMRGALARAGLADRKGCRGLSIFRHTLATRLLSAGQPLKTISDILGHATSQSTLIYTKVDLPALRGVALSEHEVLG